MAFVIVVVVTFVVVAVTFFVVHADAVLCVVVFVLFFADVSNFGP